MDPPGTHRSSAVWGPSGQGRDGGEVVLWGSPALAYAAESEGMVLTDVSPLATTANGINEIAILSAGIGQAVRPSVCRWSVAVTVHLA